jgi:hypothetical protein
MSPFDDGDLSDLMRLALVSKRSSSGFWPIRARVFRSAQVQSHDDRSSVWSLVRVGSLLPSSNDDMNKRLALLARIVPDLHEVQAMMPESRNGGLQLTFPDKRASITFFGNVNVSNLTNVSGSSVPRHRRAHDPGAEHDTGERFRMRDRC